MIKYYGTPITGNDVIMALAGSDFLVSYYRPDQIKIIPHIARTYILDNGAFSAHKKGDKIDWLKYKDWVIENSFANCNFHIIPDVIGGSENQNMKLMSGWDLRDGWPVWHIGDSIEMLNDILSGFDRVAIGGSSDRFRLGSEQWWNKIDKAMGVLCDEHGRPRVKIHGLMMLHPNYRCIPMYSADTATLARNLTKPNMTRKTVALIHKYKTELIEGSFRWNGLEMDKQEYLFND